MTDTPLTPPAATSTLVLTPPEPVAAVTTTKAGWTTGYYHGNPPNCGVWAVPAGASITSAQAQPTPPMAGRPK
jgi:hypothetical protein